MLIVLALGCSPKVPALPGTVPVSGTVTYKGSPVGGAAVGFLPKDKLTGKPANGLTDEQGKFELKTYVAGATQQKGVLPGEYQVTVTKIAAGLAPSYETFKADVATPMTSDPQSKAVKDTAKLELPARYGDPEKSGLTFTVKPSDNEPVNLTLTDE